MTSTRRRRTLIRVLCLLALPLVFALMIVWHECGHTVAAWAVGDPTARFALIDLSYPCVGCNLYDSAALPPAANAFVNLAGVLATQLIAWIAVIIVVRRRRTTPFTWLLIDVLIVTVADLIWQCVQPLLPGAEQDATLGTHVTYVDGSAIVDFLHQTTGAPNAVIAAGLLSVIVVDLIALTAVLTRGARRRKGANTTTAAAPVSATAKTSGS